MAFRGRSILIRTTEDGRIFIQPGIDLQIAELYELQAREKFPEEYERIITQWGTLEYDISADGSTVLGVVEPENYICESDRIELERFGQGIHGPGRVMKPITGNSFLRLAEGQLARAVAAWERIRTEPEYLYSKIVRDAQTAGELMPDEHGLAPTAADLLSRPRYVAMRFRYLAHNISLDVGTWFVLCEYFRDIKELDEREECFGDFPKRRLLMSQVKVILDSLMKSQYKSFRREAAFLPDWRSICTRDTTHLDYGGAILQFNFGNYFNLKETLSSRDSIKGAIARMHMQGPFKLATKFLLQDISDAFLNTTEEEKAKLAPDFRDAWAEIELTSDIIAMLGDDGEDWENAPRDDRYIAHALNGRKSEPIFTTAIIEKHIKSVQSLKSESVCRKIWAEIEKVSMKREKLPIEKVLAFAPVVPSWTHKPTLLTHARANEMSEVQSIQDALDAEEKVLHFSNIEPVIPEPKPISCLSQSQAECMNDDQGTSAQKCLKKKTRGNLGSMPPVHQLSESSTVSQPVDKNTPKEVLGIYRVGAKNYDTMHRLLLRNEGCMDWVDFEKALARIEFSKIPSCGSAVVFNPPSWANSTPFCVQRPHGSEMSPGLVRALGGRLKQQYDWTIDFFSASDE